MLTYGENVKLHLLATTQELSLLGKKGSHKPSLKRSHQPAAVKVAAPSLRRKLPPWSWGWHGKGKLIHCFLPYLAIHQCSVPYCLTRANDNALMMEKVVLVCYLFFLKLKKMEEHYEPKLSFQEHANTREQRWPLSFSLQKYIFFSPSWEGLSFGTLN